MKSLVPEGPLQKILKFLQLRWFLIALVILLAWGMWIGFHTSPEQASRFPKHLVSWASGLLTATVLFLMSITLDSRKLMQSFRSPGPVVWATFVNACLLPISAFPLARWQGSPDFAVGLLIASAVPSTMAAASVFTRRSHGNDAISLLVTIITNGACFLVTPFWLQVGLGSSVDLETWPLISKLFITALVPIAVGQLARIVPVLRGGADHRKVAFGVAAQICMLAIVFWTSIQGGVKLQGGNGRLLSGIPALIVWGSCLGLHLWGIFLAVAGAKLWRIRAEDTVAAAFSASQKTLPIGVFIATELGAKGYPFAVFPILMFHASQLILDTLFVEPFQRWIARARDREMGASSPGAQARASISGADDRQRPAS